MARSVKGYVALGAAAALGLAGAFLLRGTDRADCAVASGGGAALGGPLTLVGEDGAEITAAELFDRPALLYFGFATCPDICPVDVARNAAAVDHLAEDGFVVRPLFVTVDPARDTPAALAAWTDTIHPDLLGLTGSAGQIAAAARAWGVSYSVTEPAAPAAGHEGHAMPEGPVVTHSGWTYLVLPPGDFAELFARDLSPEEVARRASCHLD